MQTLPRKIGPKERVLRQLWLRTQRRAYHPKFWFSYYRLRKQFSLSFLRMSDVRVTVPKGKLPNCDACQEICCTGPNSQVSLRLRDIAALLDNGLGYAITQDKFSLSKNHNMFDDIFPVLRQDKTKTCLLLTTDLTCGAYPNWPLSCARYPFALDVERRTVFYAKGCGSWDLVRGDNAPQREYALAQAALESYNERIKDIILLHMALDELREMGLLAYLRLEFLQKPARSSLLQLLRPKN